MALPVLTLDETAFVNNSNLMLRYARESGALIAPHAKTPMAPALVRSLVEGGAWGATVADARQAAVMADAGILRLIHANEAGGIFGAHRLASFAALRPNTEIYVFANSIAAIHALDAAWRDNAKLPAVARARRSRRRTRRRAHACGSQCRRRGDRRDRRPAEAGGRRNLRRLCGARNARGDAAGDRRVDVACGRCARPGEAGRGAERRAYRHRGRLGLFRPCGRRAETRCRTRRSRAARFAQRLDFFHDHGIYDRSLAALDERSGFQLGAKSWRRAALFALPSGCGRRFCLDPSPTWQSAGSACATFRSITICPSPSSSTAPGARFQAPLPGA